MADQFAQFTDDEIELLRRLSGPSLAQHAASERTSLTDAVRYPEPLDGLNTKALARPTINRAASELSRLTASNVVLLRAQGKKGTFATNDCQALNPALLKIVSEREDARAQAMRRRELEWLQLASCLDQEPLRIGAYQSHAERFLASAGRLMVKYFPWVSCHLDIEENRIRADKSRGLVRDRFDVGEYDVMLVPRASEPTHLDVVYTYSFRVVGSLARLNALRDSGNVIQVQRLRGERLLVAPVGTSSRRRLRDLLMDAGIDIEDGSVELIEDKSPNSMRIRAETGQGLAIISDEYTAVGGSTSAFPLLALGYEGGHPKIHKVEMGLLRQRWTGTPRQRAFDFVIRELVAQEQRRDRAAAQD